MMTFAYGVVIQHCQFKKRGERKSQVIFQSQRAGLVVI